MPKTNAKRAKVTTEKRIKIETAKLGAPKFPGHTCPSIDYVQEMLEQIAERGDVWAVSQAEYARDILEYVRISIFLKPTIEKKHLNFRNSQFCLPVNLNCFNFETFARF